MKNTICFKHILVLLFVSLLLSCTAKTTVSPTLPHPTSTPSPAVQSILTLTSTPEHEPVAKTGWEAVEARLSLEILHTPGGKCEWEVLGWMEQEVYIWALCQAGPGKGSQAASIPAVLHLRADQSIETVELIEGNYRANVPRLFPPSVQGRVTAHRFEGHTVIDHLAERWDDPGLAPIIFLQTGEPLPRAGAPALPGISAARVDRLTPIVTLGAGDVARLAYLPDGRLVVYGKTGIGLVDPKTLETTAPYQKTLAGLKGGLSPDGRLLVAWRNREIIVMDEGNGALLQDLDPGEIEGRVVSATFSPDGETLAVEIRPSGEEVYSHTIAIFRWKDGTLLNHWDMQGMGLVFSPDGLTLASLNSMSGLKLWSVPDGKLLHTFDVVAHSATFSTDGRTLTIADMQGVRILSLGNPGEMKPLPIPIDSSTGVALSPDGSRLLTWSSDSSPTRLWRVSDLAMLYELPVKGVTAAAFHPDGTTFALAGEGAIGFYSVSKGARMGAVADRFPAVAGLSFSPDRLPGAGAHLAVLYGLNTRSTLLANWTIPQGTHTFVSADYSAISLETMGGSSGIALGTWNQTVQLVDPAGGKLLRTLNGLSAQVQDLAQDPLGQLAASSMDEVRRFFLPDPNEQSGQAISLPGGWVDALSWQCFLVAASLDGTIRVMDDMQQGVSQTLMSSDAGYDHHLAVPPDCAQMLDGKNQTIYRWQTNDWQELASWVQPAGITAMAVSPDGSLLAVGLANGLVNLLDCARGDVLRVLSGSAAQVTALEFSADGSYLAIGGTDGVVVVWGIEEE